MIYIGIHHNTLTCCRIDQSTKTGAEICESILAYAEVKHHICQPFPKCDIIHEKHMTHAHWFIVQIVMSLKNNAFVQNIWSVLPCTTHIVMYYKLFQNIAECTRIWGHVVKLINVPKQTLRVKAYINENIATYAKVKNVSVKESQILIPFTQEPVTNSRWTT